MSWSKVLFLGAQVSTKHRPTSFLSYIKALNKRKLINTKQTKVNLSGRGERTLLRHTIMAAAEDPTPYLEELRHLRSIAKHPSTINLLSSEISNLEKDQSPPLPPQSSPPRRCQETTSAAEKAEQVPNFWLWNLISNWTVEGIGLIEQNYGYTISQLVTFSLFDWAF